MNNSDKELRAALSILLVLQLTMLTALFTQTAPHPPLTTPLFGLGPFLGASLAMVTAALVLGGTSRFGRFMAILSAVMALFSFGPQKWIDPAIESIWPAVLLGQMASIAIVTLVVLKRRKGSMVR